MSHQIKSENPTGLLHTPTLTNGAAKPTVVGSAPGTTPQATRAEVKKKRNYAKWAVSFGSVAIFLVIWQMYAKTVSPLLLVPPTAIVSAFKDMLSNGELASAAAQSLKVLVVGFGIGFSLAIPIGLLWARFKVVDWAIQPFVSALFSTPLVALVPLYVLWFGFGFTAKIAIVASFAFFPVLLNTYQGAVSVDPMHLDVAKVFKATEWETWRHVVLPSCIPFVVAGLNVSVGHALTGLVISEFYTNASGLGGIVLTASGTFQTARMFVPIVIIVALGITLMAGTRWLKRKIAPWAAQRTGR
jgi:sulfonate transport system permease protein